MSPVLLRGIGRLYSSARAGVIDDAAILVDGERIAWAGALSKLPGGLSELPGGVSLPPANLAVTDEIDLGGALVTPGLIDAHTHPVYGGHRFDEIARRSSGASYAEIAAAGGGIASTVAATRATPSAALAAGLRSRLLRCLAAGTTTVEAKTGYHLDKEGELAAVRLLAEAGRDGALPSVEVTFLGGHAVGPEWEGDPDGYAAAVASWSAPAAEAGARHADVFCDAGYFTPAQSRVMLEAARAAGLIPRIHADELARTGGARLAAELGCASADHLLEIEASDAAALAAAKVVATLAPITALAMGKAPPVRALLDAGVVIALGSDHNPGTCGTISMSLVVALAVAELGCSVDEALTAATAGGARSLRLADRGQVAAGMRADLVAWDADHEGAFAWAYGLPAIGVWKAGARVA